MYDSHYDQLTTIFFNFDRNNDKRDMAKFITNLKEMHRFIEPGIRNIQGGTIVLYFDTEETMRDEMDIKKEQLDDPIEMFHRSVELFYALQQEEYIPEDIDYLFEIEGVQTVKTKEDLSTLIDDGLDVVLLCYLKESEIGCSTSIEEDKDTGLTEKGKEYAKITLEKGAALDISHASKKSVDDILKIVEDKKVNGFNPIVVASHSNCRSICDRPRNLSDEQILKLRDMGGYLGLFTNNNFVHLKNKGETVRDFDKRPNDFMEHLNHVIKDLDYPLDRILISTDDMDFNPDESYHNLWTFPLKDIHEGLKETISGEYSKEVAEQLLITNGKQYNQSVRNNKKRHQCFRK